MDYRKNFGFSHKAGIIMPISSLPGKYGIGSFGSEAYDFVDFLHATGQTCWQVLPLNPTSYGDSPYQSPCSTAGNPYFIDLERLAADGLLTPSELRQHRNSSKRVDYGWLFQTRYAALRLAHSRFTPDKAYRTFVRQQSSWLEDYALFMALKVHYGFAPWNTWAQEHRDYRQAQLHKSEFAQEMAFWCWTQYAFFSQWRSLRDHAHAQGIRIIANLAMVPMQDYLELSNQEGRMNTPATAEGNWGWRLRPRYDTEKLREKMLSLVTRTGRQK